MSDRTPEPMGESQAEQEKRSDRDPHMNRRGFVQWSGAAAVGAGLVAHNAGASSQSSPEATPSTEEGAEQAVSAEDSEARRAPWAGEPVAGPAVPPNVPPWMTVWGTYPSEYGSRSSFEDHVVRLPSDTSSRSPLADLHGTMTPNSLFFERHHAGIPDIDPAEHRLMVHGMVENAFIFTVDDIKRFPATSVIHFHECSGNSGSEWTEDTIADTVQAGFGLLSQTEWTGVPVKTILNEVGASADATWILAEGADAAGMDRSIPMDKMMDDALIAYAMNGEALRPAQGYPLRLVLPGWEGNSQIKWLRRLEVGDGPWETREETSKYTDLMPDGTARQFTFVMEAKSVITNPSGGHTLSDHGFHEISGLAWSGRGRITRVEVSVDGGETWEDAVLQEPVLPIALTRFRFPWVWDGQSARLQSRATDETGYVQPTIQDLVDVRGTRSNYHMNGIKTWVVDENGEVTSGWG
jgi:sulfane dehydrogenase subunit SoxC